MTDNVKRFTISLSAIIVLVLLSVEANAFSSQIRGGGGDADFKQGKGSYSMIGADIFFFEGKNLELFIGGESLQSTATNVKGKDGFSGGIYNYNSDLSFKYTGVTYGLRLKPAMSGRWRPYLALGGIGGTADYEITNIRNAVLLSKSKDSGNFAGGRVGLGMDIGVSRRVSLGIEANYTQTSAAFKAVVASAATGEVKEIKLIDGVSTVGLSLGLRYAF